MEHYKIRKEELDPTRYNLFRWADRVVGEVKEMDEKADRGYEKRFYENPKVQRALQTRGLFMVLYSTLTLPISIPATIIRSFKELKNTSRSKSQKCARL